MVVLHQGQQCVAALHRALHRDERPAGIARIALAFDVDHADVGEPFRGKVGRDTQILPVDRSRRGPAAAQEIPQPRFIFVGVLERFVGGVPGLDILPEAPVFPGFGVLAGGLVGSFRRPGLDRRAPLRPGSARRRRGLLPGLPRGARGLDPAHAGKL